MLAGVVLCLVAPACGGDTSISRWWWISLDNPFAGVHTIVMIVDFGPVADTDVGDLSGRLVWDETEVALCGVEIRDEVGEGSLGVGDGFMTTEGCGENPRAMHEAFAEFGMPETACVTARLDGVDHEICQPLRVLGGSSPPDPVVVERTGTVTYGELSVEVFNGTPAVDGFLRWGLERFERAGLPLPRVGSVTFLQDPSTCSGVAGLASRGDEGAAITLCATADSVCENEDCTSWSRSMRHLWLHELAHPWLDGNVDEPIRNRFLDLVGLERWSDPDGPWARRGVERAANTIAFGLIDEPVILRLGFQGTCEQRDEGFRLLTGLDPITRCIDGDLDTPWFRDGEEHEP
jgi:hypothetical protein